MTGQSNLAPKWSPDGRAIAYRRQATFCDGISIVDADGSNNRIVPLPTGSCEFDWSPDGKALAYTSFVTPGGVSGVFLVPPYGGTAKGISPNCVPGPTCGAPTFGYLQWLSDGYRLVEQGAGNQYSIFDVRTGSTTALGSPPNGEQLYQWSPDMTKVLFIIVDGALPRVGVMNADLTAPQFISPAGRQGGVARWQPAP